MTDYANILQEGQDVTAVAPSDRKALFREREIQAAVDALSQKRSVLLVGPPGVGKTSVLLGSAQQFAIETSNKVFRFTTTQIMSGTRWLGEWQSKLTTSWRNPNGAMPF
jgi:MoxR-like ATPase